MSQLNGIYEKFPQVMVNVMANAEQKAAYKEDEYIAGFIESQQQNLMGMGRVLVRVSGTEPKSVSWWRARTPPPSKPAPGALKR